MKTEDFKKIGSIDFTNYYPKEGERTEVSIIQFEEALQRAKNEGATHLNYEVRLDGYTVVTVWANFVKYLTEEEKKQETKQRLEQEIERIKKEIEKL